MRAKAAIYRELGAGLFILFWSLLGVWLGTSVALGHEPVVQMVSGWAVYSSTPNHDGCLSWSCNYDDSNNARANSSFTEFEIVDTGYWGGTANPTTIVFGVLSIYDEYGNHSVSYTDWRCVLVNGVNASRSTYWFYNGLNATNNYVLADQKLWNDTQGECPFFVLNAGFHMLLFKGQ
jgi:hypothetical protein